MDFLKVRGRVKPSESLKTKQVQNGNLPYQLSEGSVK